MYFVNLLNEVWELRSFVLILSTKYFMKQLVAMESHTKKKHFKLNQVLPTKLN